MINSPCLYHMWFFKIKLSTKFFYFTFFTLEFGNVIGRRQRAGGDVMTKMLRVGFGGLGRRLAAGICYFRGDEFLTTVITVLSGDLWVLGCESWSDSLDSGFLQFSGLCFLILWLLRDVLEQISQLHISQDLSFLSSLILFSSSVIFFNLWQQEWHLVLISSKNWDFITLFYFQTFNTSACRTSNFTFITVMAEERTFSSEVRVAPLGLCFTL